MKNHEKIIIIGLDGATWKLLDPWIKQNKLPWFKQAKETWFSTILRSTLPPITGSAWVTFQTGVNPGKHGIFDFVKYRKDGENRLISSLDVNYPTIWEALEDKGILSCIVNLPVTYPLKKSKSIVVSCLLTPKGKQYVLNNRIYQKLTGLNYVVDPCETTFGSPQASMKNRKKIYKEVLRMTEARIKASLALVDESWDLFFVLFKSTDIVQHLYWDSRETIELYELIEEGIQQLIAKVEAEKGGNLTVIICSDHGFSQGEKVSFSLYRWLENEGYLSEAKPAYYSWLRLGYRLLKKIPVFSNQKIKVETIRKKLTVQETRDTLKSARINAQTWPVPFGIYLNSKAIKPTLLNKLVNIKYQNRKVLKQIFRKEEIYKGENLAEAPDIVFLPNDWVKIDANPFQKEVFKKLHGYLAGSHYSDPDGILMIKPSKNIKIKKFQKYNIQDIFPTVMEIFKKNIPGYCDGQSLVELKSKNTKTEKRRIDNIITKEIKNL